MVALVALLVVVSISVVSLSIDGRRTGVVPMPSSRRMRTVISEAIGAYGSALRIVDLGSGWGGLARRIAHAYPDRHVVAVERSLVPLLYSRLASLIRIVPNLHHQRTDFGSLTLSGLTIYVTYISGDAMRKLREQFERDQPRDGVLISCAFAMPGWTPVRTLTARGLMHTPIYVYEY